MAWTKRASRCRTCAAACRGQRLKADHVDGDEEGVEVENLWCSLKASKGLEVDHVGVDEEGVEVQLTVLVWTKMW